MLILVLDQFFNLQLNVLKRFDTDLSTKTNLMNYASIQLVYCFRVLFSEDLSCMFSSNNKKYPFHTVFHNIHAKQLTMKLPKKPTKKHAFFAHYNSNACADTDHVESIFCHDSNINSLLRVFFSRFLR